MEKMFVTVKNSCHQAVISVKKVVGNADELYSYCKEQLSVKQVASEREFIFIDSCDVDRPNVDAASWNRKYTQC